MRGEESIDADVVVGHVHLKVADLERAVRFYSEVLGFDVMQRLGPDDQPRESWPRDTNGNLQMLTMRLDLEALRRG